MRLHYPATTERVEVACHACQGQRLRNGLPCERCGSDGILHPGISKDQLTLLAGARDPHELIQGLHHLAALEATAEDDARAEEKAALEAEDAAWVARARENMAAADAARGAYLVAAVTLERMAWLRSNRKIA